MQKQLPEKFCKKAVLKNFAIITGKQLCWRLFLIQNIAKFFKAPALKNICERLLLKMFMKLRKVRLESSDFEISTQIKKPTKY